MAITTKHIADEEYKRKLIGRTLQPFYASDEEPEPLQSAVVDSVVARRWNTAGFFEPATEITREADQPITTASGKKKAKQHSAQHQPAAPRDGYHSEGPVSSAPLITSPVKGGAKIVAKGPATTSQKEFAWSSFQASPAPDVLPLPDSVRWHSHDEDLKSQDSGSVASSDLCAKKTAASAAARAKAPKSPAAVRRGAELNPTVQALFATSTAGAASAFTGDTALSVISRATPAAAAAAGVSSGTVSILRSPHLVSGPDVMGASSGTVSIPIDVQTLFKCAGRNVATSSPILSAIANSSSLSSSPVLAGLRPLSTTPKLRPSTAGTPPPDSPQNATDRASTPTASSGASRTVAARQLLTPSQAAAKALQAKDAISRQKPPNLNSHQGQPLTVLASMQTSSLRGDALTPQQQAAPTPVPLPPLIPVLNACGRPPAAPALPAPDVPSANPAAVKQQMQQSSSLISDQVGCAHEHRYPQPQLPPPCVELPSASAGATVAASHPLSVQGRFRETQASDLSLVPSVLESSQQQPLHPILLALGRTPNSGSAASPAACSTEPFPAEHKVADSLQPVQASVLGASSLLCSEGLPVASQAPLAGTSAAPVPVPRASDSSAPAPSSGGSGGKTKLPKAATASFLAPSQALRKRP